MGIRMDQFAGPAPAARKFLDAHEVEPEICTGCNRPFVFKRVVTGTFAGMFGDEYPLHQRELRDGRTADEYLQASPWSSGPVFFIVLRVSSGEVYEWTEEEMEEWLR